MEGGVKPWVKNQLAKQNWQVQGRVDVFEHWITQQFGSSQISQIVEVKSEVSEINKMVNKLYDMSFIPVLVIRKIEPEIEVENI